MPDDYSTPATYIAALKAANPRSTITSETAERALEGINASAIDIATVIDEINTGDYVERLLESVSERLPDNVRKLIESGMIAVGEIALPNFDARVVPVGAGHAILINRGTHQFVYRIARILATRFVPDDRDEPVAPLEDTARIMAEAFAWYLNTGQAFGPQYPITLEQLQLANLITLEAMKFILCHEIAHAVTDREAPPEYRTEVDASPHLDEHGADVFGAMWALGLASGEAPQDAWNMAVRYAGIEFMLQVWAVFEQLGYEFSDTHPPATDRLEVIRLFIADKCYEPTWDALTSISQGTAQLFAKITELLNDPEKLQDIIAAEVPHLLAELDALLDRCATFPVPNYCTFYSEAGRIFDRGYPDQLMAHIAEIAAEFISGNKDEPWSMERARRLQRFKLLIGYLEHLNEPARAHFQAALGLRR
ncbi:MAG TPA: phage exclusion protein Lit family protein [Sphingomicrobium sp.]|nr:phage exclusion protein Lit family protein [Sphingomicrobium sp.]